MDPKQRERGRAFRPPAMSRLVLLLAKSLFLPWCMERASGELRVQVDDADLAVLRALAGRRVLLLPNHPTHVDPVVMLEVARRARQDWYFPAAREVFAWNLGLRGWVFQRCGVYSVIRGAVDRRSFAMTQQILVEGRHPLVIYIEGEVSLENDTLIPFEPGVLQLALRAQETLRDGSASADDPSIAVVPVAMKTFYAPGIEHVPAEAVPALERAVGVAPAARFTSWPALRARLVAIGAALIATVERELAMAGRAELPMAERIARRKARLLARMEAYLDLAARGSLLDRIRAVRNRMDRITHTYDDISELSPYERTRLESRRRAFVQFERDLGRLVTFLTLEGRYLNAGDPPERFAEVVIRLEQEVFGSQRLKAARSAVVRIGALLELGAHLAAYREGRKETATALAARLESAVSDMLRQMRPAPSP